MNQTIQSDKTTSGHANQNLNQLVSFRVAEEELAVPIHLVQEIIRHPDVTRVPAAPSYVDGIGNLRGDILPIINLRTRLGLKSKSRDDHTRVVVLMASGNPTGIVVDSVSEVMTIDEKILQHPPESISGIEGQYFKSIAKVDEGKRLVMILDEKKMLPDLNWESEGNSTMEATQEKVERENTLRSQMDVEQCVTFKVGGEEYAINIMQVKEIIRVTEITPVPKAPNYITGVMSLRNHLLAIMDLRIRFNLQDQTEKGNSDQQQDENKRIVVVDLNGILTGIQVDSVSQVLTMEKSKIEQPPSIVKSAETDCLKGVGKLEGGKRILMLLDVSKLISDADAATLQQASSAKMISESSQVRKEHANDEAQLVCFRVDQEEYALDIMRVQEIIRLRDITSVPHTKIYMEGIINLRGTVVPVVDMRTRFGLSKADRTEQNRIVVVNISNKITGLIVDSVSEVIRMPRSQIEIAPTTVSDQTDNYI